ncbi:MAG: His/Gly/Thr/Pro-type tRNA ligase C-terminal domain-containing protein [Candidatus Pacebacteria bacterium]|nr:His/Gly/Thr/Pro-type tRNA ligase C-terminal domain-containing protein [Candidatus Paceibacterota bacterium]
MKKDNKDFVIKTSLDRATEVADSYGFITIETPGVSKDAEKKCKGICNVPDESRCTEKATLISLYSNEWSGLSRPMSIIYDLPFKKSGKRKPPKTNFYGLDIIGANGAIAEATLIQTAKAILEEAGYKKLVFEINSIGEREALSRFEKELTAYFRKNISSLSPDEQKLFKDNVFELLKTNKVSKTLKKLIEDAPQSISFLSEPGRVHLKNVLEYLEELNIDYVMNCHLIESRDYSSHTSFAIKSNKGKILAIGSRYGSLVRKIGLRKDIPAVGIRLSYKDIKPSVRKKKVTKKNFYFVQVGPEAKLKSLEVIEMLRKKKISTYHSLMRDKISSQLSTAENLKLPYVVIMGKKEAHERTIAVRENITRSQKNIPLDDLPDYIKKLEKNLSKKK